MRHRLPALVLTRIVVTALLVSREGAHLDRPPRAAGGSQRSVTHLVGHRRAGIPVDVTELLRQALVKDCRTRAGGCGRFTPI